jgi:hypothetical protein
MAVLNNELKQQQDFYAKLAYVGLYTSLHKLALMPEGTKAGDLHWRCEGLDIWNSWGNYCVAPKSVGCQTMN